MATVAEFFVEFPTSLPIYDRVGAIVFGLGDVRVRVQKSQIGFYRAHPFAAVWVPAQYLKSGGAPLVLSVYLHERDYSGRWKQIVSPSRGRFTHHLELHSADEVDAEVAAWLRRAWDEAA